MTCTEQGPGAGEPLKSEKSIQYVADVTCQGTQTSVLKAAETCTQAGLITSEAATQTDSRSGAEEPLKSEKSIQCVADVTCQGIQTSVLKAAETCTQAGLITSEAATQTDSG